MAIKIRRIVPQLLVLDLERAIAFYVRQLGFTLCFCYEDFYAGVEKDGHSIHLKKGSYSIQERITRRLNEDLDLIFSVDDIHVLFEKIAKKDVEVVQPLREMPYGTEFYVSDPDGHVIAFMD